MDRGGKCGWQPADCDAGQPAFRRFGHNRIDHARLREPRRPLARLLASRDVERLHVPSRPAGEVIEFGFVYGFQRSVPDQPGHRNRLPRLRPLNTRSRLQDLAAGPQNGTWGSPRAADLYRDSANNVAAIETGRPGISSRVCQVSAAGENDPWSAADSKVSSWLDEVTESAVGTLVDRHSRYVGLVYVPGNHDADTGAYRC